MNHPHTQIQYLRHPRNRKKKGVMIAFVNPHVLDEVLFGFSMCSSKDRWDRPNELKMEDFGKKLAFKRAIKWADYEDAAESQIPKNAEDQIASFVYIPKTVFTPLKDFINGNRKYYSDKNFVEWTNFSKQ
jgi:hypothetical protein